jgi:uncharacterized membrane protein
MKQTLEQMMKRRAKRTSAFELKKLNVEHIKTAVIMYLETLPTYHINEIIDIDIPALTTELVDIKVYTKDK